MKFPVFALIFFGASFFPLLAEYITITVEDADLDMPLEGAVVHSWDGRQYECDENGQISLEVPDDRQVVVRVAYPGYENGRLVISPGGAGRFTVSLQLDGLLESRELLIEARRPGTSETRSGRSVAISDKDLSRTAEIGIVEDVMTSIKLLPGVGYSGYYNAMPSIRGGSPEDLTAVLDGFYIEQPYHWGGTVSIFDPKMIQSARLSHGVFSARYGHTISGLLELSSRKPSSTEAELELGVSTSATNFSLSQPLNGKGGVLFMGKVTYWDAFVWTAQRFSEDAKMIAQAPYIRSGALAANYHLSPDLDWTLTGFFGTDGLGIKVQNETAGPNTTNQFLDWENTVGFLISGITYNPWSDTLIKATLGIGFRQADLNMDNRTDTRGFYSQDFLDDFGGLLNGKTHYEFLDQKTYMRMTDTRINYQGRLDLDRDLGGGFLFAVGAQEMHTQWIQNGDTRFLYEEKADNLIVNGGRIDEAYIGYPFLYSVDARNRAFISSAYTLMEYTAENGRFGAELGLRADHIYFVGRDFTVQTTPAFNPRLNLDFGILENLRGLDSLRLTIGTGLFSSVTDTLQHLEKRSGVSDRDMKQNRSWTSVAGTQMDFTQGLSLNIEGYFKYIFDRAYQYANFDRNPANQELVYKFDGKGIVMGFDLMLQKFTSRYWDGWISYSFTHARYKDPQNSSKDSGSDGNEGAGADWYYPSFHRFHTLNAVLNLKPVQHFNIATRIGFVSGSPVKSLGQILTYPVVIDPGTPQEIILEKWKREEVYSDKKRGAFSLPLDLKFSLYDFNKTGKVKSEVYFAVENLLSLVYKPKGDPVLDSSTGKEEEVSREMPIPMMSFGFKWSY
ncbi:MAG: TonB-dependent receptor plug domain-containing protein [Spirochaetales bacterium]|jgi:hypothetical protein|nr:TonB-dependent receptor plug domain-containing protein [Spirochaetales bacterium]